MQSYFYLPDQNVVLEPAFEVLPGLWIGKQSGTPLEQIAREYPSLVVIDQIKLRAMKTATAERLAANAGGERQAPGARSLANQPRQRSAL